MGADDRAVPRRHRSPVVSRLVVAGSAVALLAAGAAGPASAGAAGDVGGAAEAPGAIRADGVAGAAGATAVVLPVDGPVTRLFVRPAERWSRGHRGVDLAAEPGTPVRSPVTGTVEFAGPVAGRTVLTVVRGDGLRCSLEPLADVVEAGTPVAAGDVVGVVAGQGRVGAGGEAGAGGAGATGHCGRTSCVHWGARRDGDYIDPLGLLEPVTTVLLPWS